MIRCVRALFETLVQILFLRRGPEALPHSTVLFTFVVAMWLGVGLTIVLSSGNYNLSKFLVDILLASVTLLLYGFAIKAAGHPERTLRAFTAILGCGAIISIVLFTLRAALPSVVSIKEANIVAELVWLWLLPVKGHILSRAMAMPWIIGFLIAFAVLLVQLQLLSVLQPIVAVE